MKEMIHSFPVSFVRRGLLAGLSVVLLLGTICLSGCGQSSSDKDVAGVTNQTNYVDGSSVIKAFAKADPSLKYPVYDAVRVAAAGGFADALPQLKKLDADPTLTPKQKQALDDLLQQIKSHWSERRTK